MLCIHLPTPHKYMTKGTLLSLKDFSVQIIQDHPRAHFPSASQTSTTGESHESGQDFVSPLTYLMLTPIAWTASRLVPQLPPPAAGDCPGTAMSRTWHTGNPQQPLSPRNHHILPSLLWPFLLKISHFSLANTFTTLNLFSHRSFFLIITIC